jgi:hypothetical protein
VQTVTALRLGLCSLGSRSVDDGKCAAYYAKNCTYEEAAHAHEADCRKNNDTVPHIACPCGCATGIAAPTIIKMPQTKPIIVTILKNSYEPP